MTTTPPHSNAALHSPSAQNAALHSPSAQEDRARAELLRENQLVRSTGTISKPTMAIAFGMLLLVIAAVVAKPLQHVVWALALAIIGGALMVWAATKWTRNRRGERS